MKRIPIVLGITVSIYWLLAFTIAFFHVSTDAPDQPWWDLGVFRVPGYYLGYLVFRLIEFVPGIMYDDIICAPGLYYFFGVLGLIVISLGLLTSLIAHKIIYRSIVVAEFKKKQLG